METEVRIRPAVPADRRAVEEVVEAAYAPWAEVIGVRPLPMVADYAALIAAGRVHVTAPALDALIVLVPEPDALYVDNVAVAPAAQGRGSAARSWRSPRTRRAPPDSPPCGSSPTRR
ncbi:hypothetical protein ACFQHO_16530 [Actinomadura yumaensis]|uniref:hypothetical protein n=1 Tax=Actinomadura yumaensis TaxID=111807 RepID=UPI0036172059